MFYLHVSNRTENLLRQLAEVIRVDRQADIFATELFLIQSQGMERMVAQTMASEFRSFCNYKFFLPLDFLHYICGRLGLDSEPDAFSRQVLAWRLDGLLRDIGDESCAPLRNYLKGGQVELKRYQLATRLAYIFDQYQIMRPEMLTGWERGKGVSLNATEPWQMNLWNRLLQQQETVHRGVLFKQVTDKLLVLQEGRGELPRRVSVVGLHTMPPIYLDFLVALGNCMDIHFLLLSPCRDYWDMSEIAAARSGDTMQSADRSHPLLVSLGRQGRELQNMILERTNISGEFDSYTDPCADRAEYTAACLLHRLQSDLLRGSLPETVQATAQDDDSVQVASCHSRQRELMVLKDNLLNLLYRDAGLELRDIVVMAPDIQEYAELIGTFFHDIQHSIADRSLRRRNRTIQAFTLFLRLIGGRYGWSEVMDLLRQPAIYPQFDLAPADLEQLQGWVVRSGIRWGLGADDRAGGAGETSWQAGIERLLMGCAIDTDSFVDEILPCPEPEGQGAQPLGGLCSFIRLLGRAERLFQEDCSLTDWTGRLLYFTEQLFGSGGENDTGELYTLVGSLSESGSRMHTHPVSFDVVREWFETSATETRSSSGFLRGQLTFCSMLPMRSIPFRVVCLIGLNDGVFPRQDVRDTFDLTRDSFRPGDRSSRADDRYQFLEALLAARSRLYISYIGQSIKTNKAIPPSIVVTELIEVLEKFYGAGDIVTRHSLHPFSPGYFNNSHPGKFSYDTYYLETARTLRQEPERGGRWFDSTLEPASRDIELDSILAFFVNPQKFFMRNRLGINLGGEESLPEESEIFEVTGLKKYHAEQQFISCAETGDFATLTGKLQNRGEWLLGEPGVVSARRWQAEVERYYETVMEVRPGSPVADLEVDLQLGKYRLTGKLPHRYERGCMILRYGKLRGRDLLNAWLHHLVLQETGNKGSALVVATDAIIRFREGAGEPCLETLVEVYSRGCRRPSPLFVEPAFAHLKQELKSRDPERSLGAARDSYLNSLEKGFEPEWALLFEGVDVAEIIDDPFERLSREVVHRIWDNRDE